MAGDAKNIRVWDAGDVLIYDDAAPYVPATHNPATVDDDFGTFWDFVGMLLGDPGFTLDREFETKVTNAWRYGKVKKRRKNFGLTYKFSLLEDNTLTYELVNPGSTATDVRVPLIKQKRLAFQTIADDGYIERRITKLPCDLWVTQDFFKEDPEAREVEADIYPDTAGSLFYRQVGIPA
ncbi:hypothetical protein A3N99_02830 [Mycobacteroides abscessus]|uniref:hypothetical protein n=1 Tax=Mycobacteroides abscessus TaxID=36809 RepID=UPI00078E00FC|nr:hypothetical protein [Mycobacteroides abscessus]AMU39242.1 hypothetical protein A3N99_02830 [Mycobacteroides abscessus]